MAISAGEVTLDGLAVTHLAAHAMGAAGIAFVPQTENVFATLSVHENLELGHWHGPSLAVPATQAPAGVNADDWNCHGRPPTAASASDKDTVIPLAASSWRPPAYHAAYLLRS